MAALRGDISFRYLKQFFLVIKGIRTQSVKIKGTSLWLFPVCLITKMTINMHRANNLPDGELRLRFYFPGMNFYFPQVTGNGNYEALSWIWWKQFSHSLLMSDMSRRVRKFIQNIKEFHVTFLFGYFHESTCQKTIWEFHVIFLWYYFQENPRQKILT